MFVDAVFEFWLSLRGPGQHDGVPSGMGSAGSVTMVPGSAREAVGMVMAGLTWLAGADMAAGQADCLRAGAGAVGAGRGARCRAGGVRRRERARGRRSR
jgi:hypothetical protein